MNGFALPAMDTKVEIGESKFTRRDVIKYYDYVATKSVNADIAHYNGFFVGNHPYDIRDKIDYLHETLKVI